MQGLGLDQQVCDLLRKWTTREEFDKNSVPMPTETNRTIDNRKAKTLFSDSSYKHRRYGIGHITSELSEALAPMQ